MNTCSLFNLLLAVQDIVWYKG